MHASSPPGGASIAVSMMVVPGSGPPAGRAADAAGTTPPTADDHDRIARNITEVTDVVVCRLYSTGLMLQAALQLTDGHRAADHIQLSIDELDQVISDLRNAVFSVRRSDPPGDAASDQDAAGGVP